MKNVLFFNSSHDVDDVPKSVTNRSGFGCSTVQLVDKVVINLCVRLVVATYRC